MSLFSKIEAYAAGNPLRFHTPGHKGVICPLDVTEIEDVFPLDEIERAEQSAANTYQVAHMRFLVGGSSAGVKAAILSAPGNILAENICHRAVDEGAELAGKRVFKLQRRRKDGLYIPPTADEVLSAARQCGAQTVLLTSPDYYGRVVDVSVLKAVKAAGYTLIIDGAHGAHFAFSPLFPPSPCLYADMCNMSAHKTLGAYTQSALLAVNNRAYTAAADHALKLLGTTSPSYILLGGLERAIDEAAGAENRYAALYEAVRVFKKTYTCAQNDDFSRVVLDCAAYGKTGGGTYRALLDRGVAAEKSDDRYVIFLLTLYDSSEQVERLGRIIGEVLG